jgi:2-dehydro-3-deoxygluconokinase
MDVVTLGETMVLFTPVTTSPLRFSAQFEKSIGGAESNVAIALARLGHSARWISRLGADEFGLYTRNYIRGEGVDTSGVIFDEKHPTAVFFKERRVMQEPKVYYYRKDSAASHMTPEDIRENQIADASFLHITGITPALSDTCRETVEHAIALAKKNSVPIVFDPNIRLKLWSREEARQTLMGIAAQCDIILPGIEEGEILTGATSPEEISRIFIGQGARLVVVKLGAKGAYYRTEEEEAYVPGIEVPHIVDPIGAGDGFAAGVLSGLLQKRGIREAVMLGNRIGAYALSVAGDVEGYPYREQIEPKSSHTDILR